MVFQPIRHLITLVGVFLTINKTNTGPSMVMRMEFYRDSGSQKRTNLVASHFLAKNVPYYYGPTLVVVLDQNR